MTDERLAEIRARVAGEIGPRPWKDGDPRCHCTHCRWCGVLFRTEDVGAHLMECYAATSKVTIVALLDEVDRLRAENAAQAERLQFVADGLGKALVRMTDNQALRLSDLQAELHAARQRSTP